MCGDARLMLALLLLLACAPPAPPAPESPALPFLASAQLFPPRVESGASLLFTPDGAEVWSFSPPRRHGSPQLDRWSARTRQHLERSSNSERIFALAAARHVQLPGAAGVSGQVPTLPDTLTGVLASATSTSGAPIWFTQGEPNRRAPRSGPARLVVWDTSAGAPAARYLLTEQGVREAALSPDGLDLAWLEGAEIKHFSLSALLKSTLPGVGTATHLALSADGSATAWLTEDKVHWWSNLDLAEAAAPHAQALALSSHGDLSLIGTTTGVSRWIPGLAPEPLIAAPDGIVALQIDPTESRFAALDGAGRLGVWTLDGGGPGLPEEPAEIEVMVTGERAAIARGEGWSRALKADGQLIVGSGVRSAVQDPRAQRSVGRLNLTVKREELRIQDTATGATRRVIGLHDGGILAFDASEGALATLGTDGLLRLWSLPRPGPVPDHGRDLAPGELPPLSSEQRMAQDEAPAPMWYWQQPTVDWLRWWHADGSAEMFPPELLQRQRADWMVGEDALALVHLGGVVWRWPRGGAPVKTSIGGEIANWAAYAPVGDLLLTANYQQINLWTLSGIHRLTLDVPGGVGRIQSLSPDGSTVTLRARDGERSVWDLKGLVEALGEDW